MRNRLVALGLLWGSFGIGILAACGGDDSGSGETPDASADTSLPPPPPSGDSAPPAPNAPNIMAQDLVVYTLMTASLDASGTAADSFEWTVKSVPSGSKVTTATLSGASSPRPSFPTDVSGDYVLTLTARNSVGPSTKDVKVTAVPAPLFYTQSNFSEKPVYFEYRTVGADGTGSHPIACRTNGDPDGGADQVGFFLEESMFLSDMGEDWWEAAPGDPSRVAFAQFELVDGGSNKTFLSVGTNQSSCQSPPARVNPVAEDGGTNGQGLLQPRFSRNGARVAYVEGRNSGWILATVSYDGKDRRDLSRFCPDASGTSDCFSPAVFPPRPQWLDDQTVGWVRQHTDDGGTTSGWELLVANDSANPQPHVYMTCDGTTPRSFAFLKDGTVIANRSVNASIEDLWVLKPSTPGGTCTVVRNLTNLPTTQSYARDFSVSPDEQEVAFVRRLESDAGRPDGGGLYFGGDVYIVPVNGSSPPAPLTGARQAALFGPRYVAGASALAWNGVVPPDGGYDASASGPTDFFDGGAPAIAVVVRDGGKQPTYAAQSDLDAGTYVMGGGNGGACDFSLKLCSVSARRQAGGGAMFAMAAIAGALVMRRRRRS